MELPMTVASVPGQTKHYVFVDEYNRHKRLKVMRACDGCRKRKIRCDGALQNGPWPCGACLRLKLKCVPPTLDQDDETPTSPDTNGSFSFQTQVFPSSTPSTAALPVNGVHSQPPVKEEWSAAPAVLPTSASVDQSIDASVYSSELFTQPLAPSAYPEDEYLGAPNGFHSDRNPAGPRAQMQTPPSSMSTEDPQDVAAAVKELTEHMGELSVDHQAMAPWMANQKVNLADAPTVEEADVLLPQSAFADATVKIPAEMMPSNERAMDYFGYFFTYIHPYVPVLNRAVFFEQWRNARHTISPLVLEGIFACVARYLEDTIEIRRWLALAARHEESFKDKPRISTVQALLLLTKARENVPKRGYYYRSWMSVKYMTIMAIDIGLRDHHAKHQYGDGCGLSRADCMTQTRIWQTLITHELLVGAPQGRTDFSIDLDTVQLTVPSMAPDTDQFEYQTSRRMTYMTQNVRNIKVTNLMWQSLRHQKNDWALDPAFLRHNEELAAWPDRLPADLQIQYSKDGSPPLLGREHFVAYLHIYHHLIVVMHHRPQLQTLLEKRDPQWRAQLDICLRSCILICQLQEGLLENFGLHGLQFMLRGVGFSIYCVLTCTMLHLAAITSPDQDTNAKAHMYFTRHVRVLERCLEGATPEMQVQINALREAFSADTSKPFELKNDLGLRSPALAHRPTPPRVEEALPNGATTNPDAWLLMSDTSHSKPQSATAEYSSNSLDDMNTGSSYDANGYDTATKSNFPTNQSLQQNPVTTQRKSYSLDSVMSNEQAPQQPIWDPSGIFNHWNTAFGGAQVQPLPPPQPQFIRQQQMPQQQQQQYNNTTAANPPSISQPHPHQITTQIQAQPQVQNNGAHLYTSPITATNGNGVPMSISPSIADPATAVVGHNGMPAVTPHMWQDVFTNAYVSGHGQKRYREEDLAVGPFDQQGYGVKRRG